MTDPGTLGVSISEQARKCGCNDCNADFSRKDDQSAM